MSTTQQHGSILLTHAVGLHARPSVKLTKLAKGFAARIELAMADSGPWVDAKSIVKVMGALYFRAEGADAVEAVQALTDLVARDFDEGGGDAASS